MLDRRTLLGAAAVSPLLWTAAVDAAWADTPKDVIVMAAQIDDIISMDPQESFEFSGNEVTGNIYDKLIQPDLKDPTKILPKLAEKWETSADGLTTTFHLAAGRKFASGNPVTADDVVFTLTRAVVMNKAPGFIITQLGLTKDNVTERVSAPDPQTVVIRLTEKFAPTFLFYCLSANVGGVVDKKTVMSHETAGDLGNGWLKTNSAGSGPFALRSWKASESVALDANPNAAVAPKTKRLLIVHRPDSSAQLLALQKGDIDIARNLSPEQIKTIKANTDYQTVEASKAVLLYLAMNQNDANLAKPQVRQAIKWALDYKAIATNITPNIFVEQQAFLPKGLPGALTDLPFAKNVDKAKALMKEAGLENGFEVTLDTQNVSPYADISQALQADLGAIGIRVKILPAEFRQVITKTRARQHELALLRWGSDYMDPNSNAQTFCENVDNGNDAKDRTLAWRSSWQNKELTDRADAAVHEQDADRRVREYERLQSDLQQTGPFAVLLQQVEIAAMRKSVTGLEIGPLSDSTSYANIQKT